MMQRFEKDFLLFTLCTRDLEHAGLARNRPVWLALPLLILTRHLLSRYLLSRYLDARYLQARHLQALLAPCWRVSRSAGLALGASLALAACSFAPPYEQPASPVPQAFSSSVSSSVSSSAAPLTAAASASASTSAPRLPWRQYFTDPQLQSLIETALENNRNLEVLTLRIQEARALYGIEHSSLFPGLTANASASRVGLPSEISPTGSGQTISQYSVAAIASWELDFWGRIRNLNEAALQNYLISESAQQAGALSLIGQVAMGYYSVRAIDEQMRIAQDAVATRQRTYNMFVRRHQVGSGTRLEVAEAETLLTQAQALLAELVQQRQSRLNQLAMLTADYGLTQRFASTAVTPLALVSLEAGLSSELLLYRPDIIAAESKLKAANANIGAARAAFFPSITLNAAAAGVSTDLSNLFSAGSRAWLFSPSLSLPIFDGQRLQSRLDLARVRKNIAVVEYEQTIQQAFREVSDALSDQQVLAQRLDIQRRAVKAQSERARLVRLRFDNGSSSYFEVLDAQRALLQVQQQLVQQELALVLAKVRLFTALGADEMLKQDVRAARTTAMQTAATQTATQTAAQTATPTARNVMMQANTGDMP